MWSMIVERFPSFTDWLYTFLAFVIPFTVYKVNQKLHKAVDSPWKKEEQEQQKQPSN